MCAPCGERPVWVEGSFHLSDLCEVCDGVLPLEHTHIIDVERRHLRCVCGPCAEGLPTREPARYRAVGTRVLSDPQLQLAPAEWRAIGVPLPLGFVSFDSMAQRWIARAPSPTGLEERSVDPQAWLSLAARTPLVALIRPDVEALLVGGRPTPQAWLAPIDACFELQGYVRRHWRGSQGASAWLVLDTFFERLRTTSQRIGSVRATGWKWLRQRASAWA